jgi:FkbM family methyltransferase
VYQNDLVKLSVNFNLKDCNNVYSYQLALGDKDGTAIFYVSYANYDPFNVFASSSLLPPKEHLQKASWVYFPRKIEVNVIGLDSWAEKVNIKKIDFLWLDMQGFELNMIKASHLAQNTNLIWMEVIFCEAYQGQYTFMDVLPWMTKHGFQLIATDFDVDKPESWFGNCLFRKM